MADVNPDVKLFISIGFDEKKANDTAKSKDVAPALKALIAEVFSGLREQQV